MEEPPLNAAHEYAAQAEEYAAKGQMEKAAEYHRKAAENYLRAQENTENPEALQALSLLHAQQLSKFQHYSSIPKYSGHRQTPSPQRLSPRPKQPSRQRSLPKAFHSVTSSTASIASTLAHARAPPIREDGSLLLVQPHHPRYPQSPQSLQRVSPPSSQESNSPTNSTTSSDPFDKFYTSLQEMLSRLSHPLAFATAPLDGTAPEYGGESFFVINEDAENVGMGDTIVPITRSMAATMLDPRTMNNAQRPQISESIPQMADGRDSRKTLEEYAVENRQLKLAVDQLSRKLASYKETAKSSASLLKSSMANLRAVHQQQSVPQQPSQSNARARELEDEVRRLTMENAKVKADLEKAQRRWERLKEGARRRRRDGKTPEEESIPETAEN